MTRLGCGCDNVRKGGPYTADQCGHCWSFWHDPAVNAARGGAGVVPVAVARSLPVAPQSATACVYRGGRTGAKGKCVTCRGDRYTDLFACKVHGTCHRDSLTVPGVKACRGCNERDTVTSVDAADARPDLNPRRNLLFHMHPVAGSTWRRHAEQLRRRASLFDGRVIVAATAGPGLDSPGEVEGELPDVELLVLPNDPKLREVATFLPLFSRLAADPDEVTLYGQSKGVTRKPSDTAHRWAEVLWEVCCDDWPRTLGLLKKYPVAGPFLKEERSWPEHSQSTWHFAGSWFWFRNADLLGKPDWQRIDRYSHGIEPYPSLHFSVAQAGELFLRGKGGGVDPYSHDYWQRVVEPALLRWRQGKAAAVPTGAPA